MFFFSLNPGWRGLAANCVSLKKGGLASSQGLCVCQTNTFPFLGLRWGVAPSQFRDKAPRLLHSLARGAQGGPVLIVPSPAWGIRVVPTELRETFP